ncbi:MAG: hypothetical protein ACXVKH_13750 [Candidatus Angelobacter sp.]
MPRNERNNQRNTNGRSNVRVLHFPAPRPTPSATDVDTDALADSIRKAWTQESVPTKRASVSNRGLLRLADGKIQD